MLDWIMDHHRQVVHHTSKIGGNEIQMTIWSETRQDTAILRNMLDIWEEVLDIAYPSSELTLVVPKALGERDMERFLDALRSVSEQIGGSK